MVGGDRVRLSRESYSDTSGVAVIASEADATAAGPIEGLDPTASFVSMGSYPIAGVADIDG